MIGFLVEYWAYLVPALIAIVGLGIAAYLFRNWHLVVIATTIFSLVVAIGRAFSNGERKSKERQELLTQKAIRQVQDIQGEVGQLSNQEVDRQLGKWIK